MDDTLTVSPTTLDDLTEIDALFRRAYPALLKADYPPSLLVTAIPRIARAQPRLLACGTYFAVRDMTGAIVGAGGWTRSGPPDIAGQEVTTGHVRHVVTDDRRVRQGIGRLLLHHVFEDASQAGIRRLECQSTLTARDFYAACGFEEVRPIVVPLAPGIEFPAILMHRDL